MHSTSANQLTLSMWKWKRDHEHKVVRGGSHKLSVKIFYV
jgi:hypothetical protein